MKVKSQIITFLLLVTLSFSAQGFSQYCLVVGPSQTIDSNIESVTFSGEGSSSINYTGCPGVTGLNDLTSTESVDLIQGNSYSIAIQFGTCGGNFSGVGEAWIDFNQNSIFDPSESIGTWTGTPPTAISTFNFTVPLTAPNGISRLRIIQRENGTIPIDPCETFTWGSATDFKVNFGPPIDCSAFIGDDISSPRVISTMPFSETFDNSYCYNNNSLVYNSPDVFYRIIPAEVGVSKFNISLCNSTFDTYLQVLDVDGNVLAYNDDYSACAPQSELTFNAYEHDTIFVVVQGWSDEQGEYSLEINNGEFVSLDENLNPKQVYPNPTSGILVLSGFNQDDRIEIFNLSGEVVLRALYVTNSEISLEEFPKGVYILKVSGSNFVFNEKLILE